MHNPCIWKAFFSSIKLLLSGKVMHSLGGWRLTKTQPIPVSIAREWVTATCCYPSIPIFLEGERILITGAYLGFKLCKGFGRYEKRPREWELGWKRSKANMVVNLLDRELTQVIREHMYGKSLHWLRQYPSKKPVLPMTPGSLGRRSFAFGSKVQQTRI